MSARNEIQSAGKKFYKLKEEETNPEFKGEYRFYEQVKKDDKWISGTPYNLLEGTITGIEVKEYEWQGDKIKNLIVKLDDCEFSLGLRSSGAQGILNTLAGDNPMKLSFRCGTPKEKNGKFYPTLYINKDGATNEEKRTTWKYQPAELPKVTSTKDEDGNVIKKGVKVADEFWAKVVQDVQKKIASTPKMPTIKNNSEFDNQSNVQVLDTETDNQDLPF